MLMIALLPTNTTIGLGGAGLIDRNLAARSLNRHRANIGRNRLFGSTFRVGNNSTAHRHAAASFRGL